MPSYLESAPGDHLAIHLQFLVGFSPCCFAVFPLVSVFLFQCLGVGLSPCYGRTLGRQELPSNLNIASKKVF